MGAHQRHAMAENSLETYRGIRGDWITQEDELLVYSILTAGAAAAGRLFGGFTVREIMRAAVPETYDRNKIAPRVHSLIKSKWIKKIGMRIDINTGRPGDVFRALTLLEHIAAKAAAAQMQLFGG